MAIEFTALSTEGGGLWAARRHFEFHTISSAAFRLCGCDFLNGLTLWPSFSGVELVDGAEIVLYTEEEPETAADSRRFRKLSSLFCSDSREAFHLPQSASTVFTTVFVYNQRELDRKP